ncbi:histone deacetylase domain protein, partial [Leptospira interrogans serovar Pyrogenes str. L0374]
MKKLPNEFLNEIHSQNHIQKIENSKGKRGYFDSDTPFTEKSWISAYSAANSGIILSEFLISGTIKNGFSLLRPPGHHAEHNRIMGFCMLNNVAITARYLQNNGFKKSLLLIGMSITEMEHKKSFMKTQIFFIYRFINSHFIQ